MRQIALCFLLLTLPLVAHAGRFSASADLLYWRPSFAPYDVGGSETPISTPGLIGGKASFGTRAILGYDQRCFSTQLSYLWFESYQHPIAGVVSAPDIISLDATVGFSYQNVDWRLARQLSFLKPAAILLFANARWVDIAQKLHFRLWISRQVNSLQDISPLPCKGEPLD